MTSGGKKTAHAAASKSGVLTLLKAKEERIVKSISKEAARWPSDWFMWAAAGSIVTSLALQFTKRRHLSLFLGEWAPTLLMFGLYRKAAKVKVTRS